MAELQKQNKEFMTKYAVPKDVMEVSEKIYFATRPNPTYEEIDWPEVVRLLKEWKEILTTEKMKDRCQEYIDDIESSAYAPIDASEECLFMFQDISNEYKKYPGNWGKRKKK